MRFKQSKTLEKQNNYMKFPKLERTHNPEYVSFGPRFLASVIDTLIYSLGLPLSLWFISGSSMNNVVSNSVIALGLILLPAFILTTVSKIYLLHTTGQTLGKMIVGIEVLNDKKEPLTLKRAFFREFIGKTVSGYVVGTGYLSMLFDQHHQGWHDHFVNSFVYGKRKNVVIGIGVILILLFCHFAIYSMAIAKYSRGLGPEMKAWQQSMPSTLAVPQK